MIKKVENPKEQLNMRRNEIIIFIGTYYREKRRTSELSELRKNKMETQRTRKIAENMNY